MSGRAAQTAHTTQNPRGGGSGAVAAPTAMPAIACVHAEATGPQFGLSVVNPYSCSRPQTNRDCGSRLHNPRRYGLTARPDLLASIPPNYLRARNLEGTTIGLSTSNPYWDFEIADDHVCCDTYRVLWLKLPNEQACPSTRERFGEFFVSTCSMRGPIIIADDWSAPQHWSRF